MIEISAWVLVFLVQLLFVGSVAAVHIIVQQRAIGQNYRQKIAKLEAHLESLKAPPPPSPPIEVSPSSRLIFLSEQDIAAATRSSGGASESDSERSLEDLCARLLKGNQEMTNVLDTVLERSASLGVNLGSLKGAEGLSAELKKAIQSAIDLVRQSDEALVQASDKGLELEETLRFLQTKVVSPSPASEIDFASLNEILSARIDGRSEDEVARLRDTVRQRLKAPAILPT
ncbi:MAG: hypothetical protein AAF449_02310 [Myxococcota bacterium]